MTDSTTHTKATSALLPAQLRTLRITWRDVSVTFSGVDPKMANDLTECLALNLPTAASAGHCDFAVTRSGNMATVLAGARYYEVSSQTDLFLLLTTLVPASLLEKAGVSRRMHAAGIRIGNKLLLLSGEGHMGKSSISLVAWHRGFEILGDDWLLFSKDYAGMLPIPKPLKARMTAEQFAALNASLGMGSAIFGNLLGETRALIGREEGFYNHWDEPLPVGALVFLDRPSDQGPIVERIEMSDALPLVLSQTILCQNSKTLAGVAFVRALAKRDTPVFRLCLGRSSPEAAFNAILEAIPPSLQPSRIMPLSSKF